MQWLISGPGALGQLYAGLLAQAGHEITFWGRQGPLPASSYELETQTGESYRWQSQSHTGPFDVVLVTTKIFQSDTATQHLLAHGQLDNQCPLILLHNGLGAGEALELPKGQPLLLASSRQGALKLGSHQVRHTGLGITQLGLIRGELSTQAQELLLLALKDAVTKVEWHQNIFIPLWQKLVINAVINPLTARDQIVNGDLLQPHYQSQMELLCQQACQVARADGVALEAKTLLAQIEQVLHATATNFSSMMQDIRHQRATEIDYINGYLVRRAQVHGLDVTAHAQLVQQIHQISDSFE